MVASLASLVAGLVVAVCSWMMSKIDLKLIDVLSDIVVPRVLVSTKGEKN